MKKLLCTIAIIALISCSTHKPLSKTATLDGQPARESIVVISEPYSFNHGLVTHTLPQGIYLPAFEDNDGVYYQSPSKLLLGGMFGPTLHDGGVFFKGGLSMNIYEYIIINNISTIVKLPIDFKFTINKKDDR